MGDIWLMIKKLLNRYFVSKYGKVHSPKPPLGFSIYDHPAFWQIVRYRFMKTIWMIDCIIDQYAGAERKAEWDRIEKT